MLTRIMTGLLLLMTWVSAGLAQDAVLSVDLDANESSPYWSASMPLDGMCGEVVHAVSEAAGITSNIQYKPLKRMIEDDSNNDLGNPEFFMVNQEFADIIPVCLYQAAIFYYAPNHKEKIILQSIDDLKGYRVGILTGTLVDRSYFESAGVVFEESYSRESMFKKMKLGRIDLCLVIDLVGHQIINQLFPEQHDNFVAIQLVKSTAPLAILLAKDYPQAEVIGDKYRQGLNRIIQNGTYEEIMRRYDGGAHTQLDWLKQLRHFERLYGIREAGNP